MRLLTCIRKIAITRNLFKRLPYQQCRTHFPAATVQSGTISAGKRSTNMSLHGSWPTDPASRSSESPVSSRRGLSWERTCRMTLHRSNSLQLRSNRYTCVFLRYGPVKAYLLMLLLALARGRVLSLRRVLRSALSRQKACSEILPSAHAMLPHLMRYADSSAQSTL